MSSIIKVDTIQDQNGNNIINENANTVTVGKAGDTVNIVGTLQNNGAAIPGDISSVVAGTGLSGGGTTGDVTLNIEAAQPTVTSTGTLTSFRSTGIDDNSNALAMTIDSSEQVGIGTVSPSTPLDVLTNLASDTQSTPETVLTLSTKYSNTGADGAAGAGSRLELKIPDDETNPITGAAIAGLKENGDDSVANAALAFYTSQNDTTLDEAMRIDSSGNVGIGETAPLGKLHIKTADSGASAVSANANELVIENTGNVGMTIQSANDGVGNIYFGDVANGSIGRVSYDHSSNKMKFSTAGSERMNIDTNGFLNIGDPDVTGQFQVKGGGFIISGETTAGTNSSAVYSSKRSANGIQFRFTQSSTVCGDITTNGSAVTYGSNSDYRLKENVSYDFDATTRLKQLKPARFNFIVDETNTLIDGFIAHEVQSVVPEAVTGTHNQVEVWKDNEELPEGVSIGDNKLDADGNTIPEYQGIDQSKLVPLLVKTIQELEARITQLENA